MQRIKELFRDLKARWTITCQLEMLSAAQIGSHEADNCDQTFGRDEDGNPTLPGSTLAGALRNALNDRLAGYFAPEHPDTDLLFGYVDVANASSGMRSEQESPLIVFDAIGVRLETVPGRGLPASAAIRDGVRIEPATGLAMDGKKYDREVTQPWLRFALRFDLLLGQSRNEDKILTLLQMALDALTQQEIRLGARKRRGLGACKAFMFRAYRYNLNSREGWIEYAASLYEAPLRLRTPKLNPHATFAAAVHSARPGTKFPETPTNERHRMQLAFELEVDSTLLVRSPGVQADDPDMVHLTEDGRALLSGTTLAGAMRSHCLRLLNTVGVLDAGSILGNLFGTDLNMPGTTAIRASRVLVPECALTGETRYRQTRLKVDRFTGGPIDGALFDQAPAVGGQAWFTVEVQNPSDVDVALLLLAARDLSEGLLTVGGEASVGRGLLSGKVTATLPNRILTTDSTGIDNGTVAPSPGAAAQVPATFAPQQVEFVIDRGGCSPEDSAAGLQRYLDALWKLAPAEPVSEVVSSQEATQ